MVENSVISDIRESSSVDKCNGTNFQLWEMHMSLFFYPVNSFPLSIVLWRSLPSPLLPKNYYGRRINRSLWPFLLPLILPTKLRLLIAQLPMLCGHTCRRIMINAQMSVSSRCRINIKYYGCRLLAGESTAPFIMSLQKLAKQLKGLGQPITD